MERSLRPIDPLVHVTEEATLEALGQTLARTRIEAVLKAHGVVERRVRKLTMVLTVLVCIAMNLFTEEAIDDVLVKLLQGPRFLRPDDEVEAASASAICQRRQPWSRCFVKSAIRWQRWTLAMRFCSGCV